MNVKIVSAISALCLIWGYLWIVIKQSLVTFPPFFFASIRLILGALALFLVQLVLRKSIFPKANEWGKLWMLSFLMCVGFYGTSTYGMQFVDAGLSSVLVYTMPIIIGVLAHYFLNERLNKMKIIGLVFGTLGLVVILWPQLMHLKFNLSLYGQSLIVLSAFFWAGATIYIKKYFSHYDKIKLTMWQMLLGGLALLFIAYFSENLQHIQWNTPQNIYYVFYSAILGTAFAFFIWNWLVSEIDASVASISIMSVPLIGLILGHFILHEPLTIYIWMGTILIALGILFCSLKPKVILQVE